MGDFMTGADWLTINEIIDKYPLKEGTVRRIFHDRHLNGLKKYTKKIGKFMYIREADFNKWIDEQNE